MIWLFAYALALFAGTVHPSIPVAPARGFSHTQAQSTCPPPKNDSATPPPGSGPVTPPTPKPPSVPPLCA